HGARRPRDRGRQPGRRCRRLLGQALLVAGAARPREEAGLEMTEGELPEFPTLAHDPEALQRQLLVFTRDITEIYKRERARAEELEVALAELKTAYLETIRSLAFVVEAKDAYTGQHLERCRVYGMALMQAIGIADDYPDAEYGFLLHDSGKIGIPERILSKPGPLTAAEWRVMRTHPL